MKTYNDLKPLEKDFAVDKALEVLVKILIDDEFDYSFKSPIAQKHFLDAMRLENKNNELKVIMESDEIAEELYATAEMMAEIAYYPNAEEYVLQGVVN